MAFLDASGQASAVIGGVAVIAHGFARFTADVDAAVAATPDDAAGLLALADRFGIRARIEDAENFARENLVLLLEHESTGVPLDISFAMQSFEHEAMARAVHRSIAGVELRVAPLTAMLIYKMVASRPKDLDDVRALLATGAHYDAAEVVAVLKEFDALLETDRANEFRRMLKAATPPKRRKKPAPKRS